MSEHHSPTHGDQPAYETLSETDDSPLRPLLRSGIIPLAVGALSLIGALRSGRSHPIRTVFYTVAGSLLLGIGMVQRRQDDAVVDLGSSISIGDDGDDDATTTTESTGDPAEKSITTGTTTEELSDPEPPEENTDADVSSTQIADEPAEAAGPSSEDAVPEQTDETMPDETQSEDVSEVDPEEFGSDDHGTDESGDSDEERS